MPLILQKHTSSERPDAAMKEEDVSKLKVAELKEELRSRELSVTGLKAELAKRLLEAVRSEVCLLFL